LILAVIPYTGSEKLVQMTARCIESLLPTIEEADVDVKVVAVANKPDRLLTPEELQGAEQMSIPSNVGFGPAVNKTLEYYEFFGNITDALVLNNDLVFEQKDWLLKLLAEKNKCSLYKERYVFAPMTDVTATQEAVSPRAIDEPAIRLPEISAYCWLVPFSFCQSVEVRFGFRLFNPLFPNYGSDDCTASILRKVYGRTPFKLVRRSWVKHLKAQTANELGVKAGTKELLSQLRSWKSKNKCP